MAEKISGPPFPGQPSPGHSGASDGKAALAYPGITGVSYPLDGGTSGGFSPPIGTNVDPDPHCEWYYKFRASDTSFMGPLVLDALTEEQSQIYNAVTPGTVLRDFDIIQLGCLNVDIYVSIDP